MSITPSSSIHLLFELSYDPVFLMDHAGLFTDRNASAMDCFPLQSNSGIEDILGDGFDWECVLEECRKQRQAIEVSNIGIRLPTGNRLTSAIRVAPIPKENGDEQYVLSLSLGESGLDAIQQFARQNEARVENLSKQLSQMGQELLEKTNLLVEERNKVITIIQNMGDGLVACDRNGNIIQRNETATSLLHLPQNAVGMPFVDASPSIALAVKLDPKQPEIHHPVELNLPHKEAELRVHVSPVVDDNNEYAGFVMIIQDRTKQAEVDRMKNELISIVSHELRSPLASIKGYVDLMQSGDFGVVPNEMNGYLDVISDNANRLTNLIEDMLDLSRIESGKLSMNFGKVDLQFLCDSVYLTMKPQAEQKKQRIQRDVEPGLCVSGDVDRLQQALNNLVSNAVKYTPDEGSVTIQAKQHENEVRISVTDDGYGIPAEMQPKLFQKFFRAKTRKTQHIGGTGLGLCITKSIAELHNGTVEFDSLEGEGSTFTLRLPMFRN